MNFSSLLTLFLLSKKPTTTTGRLPLPPAAHPRRVLWHGPRLLRRRRVAALGRRGAPSGLLRRRHSRRQGGQGRGERDGGAEDDARVERELWRVESGERERVVVVIERKKKKLNFLFFSLSLASCTFAKKTTTTKKNSIKTHPNS